MVLFKRILGVCLILLVFFILYPIRVVEVSNLTTNKVLGQVPVKEFNRFYLSYTMSLYKVPQAELIQAQEKGFVIEKVIFGSYPAATYYYPTEEFEKNKLDEDYWVIELKYYTQKVNFVNAFFSEHRLIQENLKWSVSINHLGASGGDLIQLSSKRSLRIVAFIKGKQFLSKVSQDKKDIDPSVLEMLYSLIE